MRSIRVRDGEMEDRAFRLQPVPAITREVVRVAGRKPESDGVGGSRLQDVRHVIRVEERYAFTRHSRRQHTCWVDFGSIEPQLVESEATRRGDCLLDWLGLQRERLPQTRRILGNDAGVEDACSRQMNAIPVEWRTMERGNDMSPKAIEQQILPRRRFDRNLRDIGFLSSGCAETDRAGHKRLVLAGMDFDTVE